MTQAKNNLILTILNSKWIVSLALFILALLPRLPDLNRFLTADEFLWVDRSRNFLAGLTNPAYRCLTVVEKWEFAEGLACTLRTGHPGVTTMWTGSFGFLVRWLADGRPGSLHDYVIAVSTNPLDPTFVAPERLGTVLVILLWVVAVYWLARRLFGAPLALVGTVFIALDPFHIALSRVIHHDALSTAFMTLSVLSALIYWGQGAGRKWLVLSGALAGFGFLSKSPALYLMPFIALAGLWFFVKGGRQQAEGGRLHPSGKAFLLLILDGLLWFGAAMAIVFTFWPAMWVIPLEAIETVFFIGSKYATGGHAKGNYFLGQISKDPGPLFYPVSWLYRTSPLVLLGLIGGLLTWLLNSRIGQSANRSSERGGPAERVGANDDSSFTQSVHLSSFARYVPLIILFILGYYLFMTIGEKKQDRYFLPAYPWLNLVAAAGLISIITYQPIGQLLSTLRATVINPQGNCYQFMRRAARGTPPRARKRETRRQGHTARGTQARDTQTQATRNPVLRPPGSPTGRLRTAEGTQHVTGPAGSRFALLLLTILIVNGFLVAANFPYYFTYYNPMLGGIKSGVKVLTVGWGEGLDLAADYLNQKTDPAHTRVASWYQSTFAPYYQGPTISYSKEKGKTLAGDYVIFYINQTQRRFPDDALFDYFEARFEPEEIITLHGLDYAWIYPSLGVDHYIQDQTFTGIASLLAWQWVDGDRPLIPGRPADYELYWEYLGKRPDELFFLRVEDAQGNRWAEGQSRPVAAENPPVEQWRQGEIIFERGTLNLPVDTPPGQYHLQIGFYTQAPAVTEGELLFTVPDAEALVTVGRADNLSTYTLPPTAIPIEQNLGDALTLLGAAWPASPLAPAVSIPLDLYWRVEHPLSANSELHVGLMDEAGQVQQAWFNLSLAETFNPAETTWQPGDIIHTRWRLDLLPEVSSGEYHFELVLPDDIMEVLPFGELVIADE